MYIKQLSVFVENRTGMLQDVAEVLSAHGINIVSLSMADTSEFGLLRILVSDPEKACVVLREANFSAVLTDVIAVKFPSRVGMLERFLKILSNAQINVEYMYIVNTEGASMVVKASDPEKAVAAIKEAGIDLAGEEVYHLDYPF